ncbi:hypothetical protein HanPSC8_Chr16g0724361 [Helianthus annuus]|nr:hypothetical protein HanPSC8_Chr16g0724361 [Helianthus annuus]
MAVVSRKPPSAEPWSPAGHPLGGGDGRVVLTQQTVELQVSYDGRRYRTPKTADGTGLQRSRKEMNLGFRQ